ncbi:Major Facilitator Superfamily protein [Arthrobacter alpinus]|uniref:Major Facilitator Superfamily protein n=2 Tax=Arthrobacter alpinus TaxID=656366 RepID=A0A1H5LQZ7_9MICC|nr:Major Facilitator Superfamily protein [Arthrobacter alpinus]
MRSLITRGQDIELRKRSRRTNIVLWLAGYGSGVLGDQMYFVALAWTATRFATPAQVGFLLAAGAVPRALLLLFGGAVADRYGPKWTALVSSAGRAVVIAAISISLSSGASDIALLVLLTTAFGIADALFLPAVASLPAYIADRSSLRRLQGARSLLQRLAMATGPPLVGFLLAHINQGATFAILSAILALSTCLLFFTRVSSPAAKSEAETPCGDSLGGTPRSRSSKNTIRMLRISLIRDARTGLDYVSKHPVLRPMLMIIALSELAIAGPIAAGIPALADDRGWGAQGVGTVLACVGIGAMTTALYLTFGPKLPHPGLYALGSVVLMGPALIVVGAAAEVWLSAGAGLVLGFCGGICGTLIQTFVITMSDPSQLGRVLSVVTLASIGAAPIAYAATGLITQFAGASFAFLCSGVLVSLTGCYALTLKPLRRATLE